MIAKLMWYTDYKPIMQNGKQFIYDQLSSYPYKSY